MKSLRHLDVKFKKYTSPTRKDQRMIEAPMAKLIRYSPNHEGFFFEEKMEEITN